MRKSKRKQIEAKGWKLGSAKEFLGLTPEEEAYIELRLKLAQGLKFRRSARGVTQVQLAQALRSSQSRVAKLEAGDRSVSLELLMRALLRLGASRSQIAAMIGARRRRKSAA